MQSHAAMLEQTRGFHIVAVAEVVNTRKTVTVTTGELFGEIVELLALPEQIGNHDFRAAARARFRPPLRRPFCRADM